MTSVLENSIYQNQQVPQGVIVLSKIMSDISPSALNSFLKLIFDVVEKNPIPPGAIDKLLKNFGLSENGNNLFCGLLMLVQALMRLPADTLKENDLKQSLKELKFSDECSNEFVVAFQNKKHDLHSSISKFGSEYFHKLVKFNWRIDITVASNFLAKSLDTIIIFEIQLSNGETEVFEISIAKFQQLRFYVASLLKEIEFIEKKNVFKI